MKLRNLTAIYHQRPRIALQLATDELILATPLDNLMIMLEYFEKAR